MNEPGIIGHFLHRYKTNHKVAVLLCHGHSRCNEMTSLVYGTFQTQRLRLWRRQHSGNSSLNVRGLGASASTLMSYLINFGGQSSFLEQVFWLSKKSDQFNQSDIANDIAALTLTLNVNRLLWCVHTVRHRDRP